MTLIVNGATNTITAASGLAIAGNTAVTGTLSATGVATLGAATNEGVTGQAFTGASAWCLYSRAITPSATNYSFLTNGSSAEINGTVKSKMLAAGVTIAEATSTGLAVTGKVVVSGDNPSVSANDSAGYLGLAGGTAVGSDGASLQLSGSTSADAGDSFSNARTHYLRNLAGTVQYATFSSTALTLGTGVNLVMAPSYIEGAEMTAPAAPAANGFRIFAEDNGAGKTRLMVQFATGAAQQLAIEP